MESVTVTCMFNQYTLLQQLTQVLLMCQDITSTVQTTLQKPPTISPTTHFSISNTQITEKLQNTNLSSIKGEFGFSQEASALKFIMIFKDICNIITWLVYRSLVAPPPPPLFFGKPVEHQCLVLMCIFFYLSLS